MVTNIALSLVEHIIISRMIKQHSSYIPTNNGMNRSSNPKTAIKCLLGRKKTVASFKHVPLNILNVTLKALTNVNSKKNYRITRT